MSLLLPNLPLALYRLEFQHDSSLHRPPRFAGSAWRGALGHMLRHIACITGASECEGCPRLHQCAYSYLFATPVPPEATKLTRYPEAPHPYVLIEDNPTPGQVTLELTLFGHANSHLPLMTSALVRAAGHPRGIAGRTLQYLGMSQWNETQENWQPLNDARGALDAQPPAMPVTPALPEQELRIEFTTPLRVRRNGQHVGPDELTFADLFGNLLRRISLLTSFHTDTPLETDFRGLTHAAREIPLLEARLRWEDLKRHSSRQHTDMALGGLVGWIRLDTTDLAPFWPYLWLGQFTHIGRATTMGLGRYRLLAESFPEQRNAS